MLRTILAAVGWALLALLAVLLLLLLTPVRVEAELKYDKPFVRVKVLCFSFRLWPLKEKKEKPAPQHLAGQEPAGQEPAAPPQKADGPAEKESREAPKPPAGKAKPKKKGLGLAELTELVSTAGWLMKIVFKVIKFRDIKVVLPIHREDAAETAIAFGRTQAYLGTALGALQNFLDLQFKQVELIPDFTGSYKYRRYLSCKIVATPFIMVTAAVYAFIRLKAGRVI